MNNFFDQKQISELTALMLLEIGAVYASIDEPFCFTSGWRSPVYIDCRQLISYPRIRRTVTDFATSVILREIGFESIDAIAGGETAGIPFAAWIAERMMIPMQYVRKIPKDFGRHAQVEGNLRPGSRILLVEDLTTDGRSKIHFCEALRKEGAVVEHTFVVFYYNIFHQTRERLQTFEIRLHTLATFEDILNAARERKYFDTRTLEEIEKFFHNPIEWSQRRGGTDNFPTD